MARTKVYRMQTSMLDTPSFHIKQSKHFFHGNTPRSVYLRNAPRAQQVAHKVFEEIGERSDTVYIDENMSRPEYARYINYALKKPSSIQEKVVFSSGQQF